MCTYGVLVTKYVFISTLCVLSMCMCILHMSSVQSVNIYCLYVKLFCFFLHCLEHALKNFTHQGTRAVVM